MKNVLAKKFSLVEVFKDFGRVFERFPLAVVAAFAATGCAIYLNDITYHGGNVEEFFVPIIFALLFCFNLSLAVDLFIESKSKSLNWKWLARAGVMAVVVLFYIFILKDLPDMAPRYLMSFFLLNAAIVFFNLLAPFFQKDRANAFWQFVIALFVRLFLTVVFFGILFLGMALLLASIDYLFSIYIDYRVYVDFALMIFGILAPVYFLAGVPSDFKVLQKDNSFPKAIGFLTRFILVPLVCLYMLVLYAYAGSIVIKGEWPLGGVSAWIIGFAVVGIVTYFFAYQLREKKEYTGFFEKWFFVVMAPLLIVLFLAVGVRVMEYGLTEARYFGAIFGLWLLYLTIYFIVSKKKDVREIVGALVLVLVISAYGPLSAFNASKWSQMNRLEAILSENSMFAEGMVVKEGYSELDEEEKGEVSSIVRYLMEQHGYEIFKPWFADDLDEKLGGIDQWYRTDVLLTLMNFEPNYVYYSADKQNYYQFILKILIRD